MPRKSTKTRPPQVGRLAELRKGLSQYELANYLGVSQANPAFRERSEKPPRSDVLPKMAQALGVTVEDLLIVADEKRLDSLAPRRKKTTAPESSASDSSVESSMRIPDVTFQDQNGKSLNFYSDLVKGKVVAVNFVFTTCTAICPLLTAAFRRVRQLMVEENLSAQLISISVDPTVDTPERLHAFPSKFKAEPGWTFVTGNTSDIDAILEEFGVAAAANLGSAFLKLS